MPSRCGEPSCSSTSTRSTSAESDDDDSWYEHDLVGLAVHDPAGAVLGEVTGLVIGAVQDLLEVRLDHRREVLVPFVEAIVTEVDIEAGHVVVDAPAGLFDLDES